MRTRTSPAVTQVRRLFKVSDPHGLHARVATSISHAAGQFEADILVYKGTWVANGKSLLELLSLCARRGELLTIVTEGTDADPSMQALQGVFLRHAAMISV